MTTFNTHSSHLLWMSAITILTLALSACANKPTYQKTNTTDINRPAINTQGIPRQYQVQRGDTVAKIAGRYGLNWREVSRLNQLDSNHTIRVGQWLTLWGQPSNLSHVSTQIAQTPKTITVKNPTTTNTNTVRFSYPIDKNNKVIRHFGEASNINGIQTKSEGMWFTGKSNDHIRAAHSGTVVHTDNTDTGGMISISHTDGFVSSYLYVKDISVKKGQRIGVGDPIAKMKTQTNGATLLEFRIAKNGVYIDPMTVLK